jgi:uncharacterized protein YecE (DUF72 family)
MRLLAGTSGFAYKEWKGSFYPRDLPASQMLRWYAERLPAVEINSTFYRFPKEQLLASWRDAVPDGFTFVLKAARTITHLRRLNNAAEPIGWFFGNARGLGDRLGPVLVQLPPNMKKDVLRLTDFLPLLPAGVRVALEFRHESWLDEEVFAILRAHGAALCAVHGEQRDSPLVATADWGYLRLRDVAYADDVLDGWVERVRTQPWREVFVFFKHEDEGAGPRLAARFLERFSR